MQENVWGHRDRLRDRAEAGRLLAERLRTMDLVDPVVVGLPRGGVPVAAEVARALAAPLDVVVVRKAGVPWQPELALGAVGEDDVRVVNQSVVDECRLDADEVERAFGKASAEVAERAARFRGGRRGVPVEGRTVVVVDDGIATGATAAAAVRVLRRRGAGRVVLAAPVAAADSVRDLERVADEVVCPMAVEFLGSISLWYDDFGQVSDAEVFRILSEQEQPPDPPERARALEPEETSVPLGGERVLPATLTRVEPMRGLVLFAHGSGSSRRSPRNTAVAHHLNVHGLGTLLFDLLTPEETRDRRNVFDVPLLGDRLLAATRWVRRQPGLAETPLGYFGASTGAAAALYAAAEEPDLVRAVVSRGGRPDLAAGRLPEVKAPTLLVVGSRDHEVLELNRRALARMRCPAHLVTVTGATHLFEEPGTLEVAADLARSWFVEHLTVQPHDVGPLDPPSHESGLHGWRPPSRRR